MALLRLAGLTKAFGGTPALSNVSFTIRAGEIAGLIGENGAGKSTLIKILAGVLRADSGELHWQGARANGANGTNGTNGWDSPRAALEAGIATIHQELASFERLTIAENLLLGEPWPRLAWGGVNWRKLNEEAARRLAACELRMDPRAMFHTLSPAQRQEVAIARALSRQAQLLILDEPTASLTEPEVERLIGQLKRLRAQGVALLYVSHRLEEIRQLADRVLVLRDGALVADEPIAAMSVARMVRDMVGRALTAGPARAARVPGAPVFTTRGLGREGLFANVSLTVHAGEIVGLAGLVGAGRSELARALYGLYPPTAGTMTLHGQPYRPRNAAEARRCGVVYVPEERKRQGFSLDHSVLSSISIGFLQSISHRGFAKHWGLIRAREEQARVERAREKFGIKARSLAQPVGSLSGGNQQKALLARWLETDPSLILLDEPTRGVDVGAKAEIHAWINRLAESGKALLLISSDLPELLALSDRILVIHRGQITASFEARQASQERILLAASGLEGIQGLQEHPEPGE